MRVTNRRTTGVRALFSALIAGLGAPLFLMATGLVHGARAVPELLMYALVPFALTGLLLVVLGRRAFLFLWCMMIVLWVALLVRAGMDGAWLIGETLRLLPERFAGWSAFGLPLWAATWIFLAGQHSLPQKRGEILVFVLWLAAFFASAYLAQFAPDVGLNVRDNALSKWVGGAVFAALPFLIPVYFTWIRSRRPRGLSDSAT